MYRGVRSILFWNIINKSVWLECKDSVEIKEHIYQTGKKAGNMEKICWKMT
jgi:hypothetical protein